MTIALSVALTLAGASRFDSARSMVRSHDGVIRRDSRAASPRLDAGVIRAGSGNWHTLTNVNRYGVIIASPANAPYAGRQAGRALTWGCGVSTYMNTWNSTLRTSCGVAWEAAVANDWILKDASGNYVRYHDCSTGQALLDVGNVGYQKAFIARVKQILTWHRGIDGVFIDNIEGSTLDNCTKSVKYQDNASYRAAMLAFVKAVGRALRAKGWYVAVNAAIHDPGAESSTGSAWDGSQYIWWVRQIAPYVDGVNMEHWQENWDAGASVRVRGGLGNQAWDGWERLPYVLQKLGKDFYALEEGALTDLNKASYLRASFLLAWKRGGGAFLYTDNYAGKGDPWSLTGTPDIGRPLVARIRVGVGFRRTFTNGVVILNPSASQAQAFGFRHEYLMPDGTATRSVVLPPGSGLVLRRATGR